MSNDVGGRAPELLQARLKEKAAAAASQVAPPDAPISSFAEAIGIAPSEPAPVTPPPPAVTEVDEKQVQALEMFPDSDIKALGAANGVVVDPYDRTAVIAKLASLGITHAYTN